MRRARPSSCVASCPTLPPYGCVPGAGPILRVSSCLSTMPFPLPQVCSGFLLRFLPLRQPLFPWATSQSLVRARCYSLSPLSLTLQCAFTLLYSIIFLFAFIFLYNFVCTFFSPLGNLFFLSFLSLFLFLFCPLYFSPFLSPSFPSPHLYFQQKFQFN